MKKLKKLNELYIDDNIATASNLCIILSCPGEAELIEQRVCAGQTGKNLEKLLKEILCRFQGINAGKSIISSANDSRYNYTIVNASNEIHFRDFNDAEPKDSDILAQKNIERVIQELTNESIDYFLICGEKAALLFDQVQRLYIGAHCSKICHIGNVGIRNKYTNKFKLSNNSTIGDLPESKRDDARIPLIAGKVIHDWGIV